MKYLSLVALSFLFAANSAFCADYVYKTQTCGHGFTLKFTTSSEATMMGALAPTPIYKCTSFGPETREGGDCLSSEVVGQTYSYRVQLGTLQYSNDLNQISSTPLFIVIYGDVLNGSGLTSETTTYGFGDSGSDHSLNTLTDATFGQMEETNGMPLDSLPALTNVHKTGNTFSGLSGYLDSVLNQDNGVTVWTKDCPTTATAFKQ